MLEKIISVKAGLITALVLIAGPACAAQSFDIAITVDDLPRHGWLPPGMTRVGIAQAHLQALKAHKVPEAFGFVNAIKLNNDPEGAAVLDAWRQAGYPLGNHTYSHMSLARAVSLQAWQADVEAGEPAVASRMQGEDWHYLRFPHLAVSNDRRDGALAYLRARGYRIADVSVTFSDWSYTDAFARCMAKGDKAAIEAMKAEYLGRVERGIAQMKADSMRVYGRVIPQVLLTHIGGFGAVTLPEVLSRLDAAGARYVTLAQAQSDPAYAVPGGGTLIERAAHEKGITLAPVAPEPVEPPLDLDNMCK